MKKDVLNKITALILSLALFMGVVPKLHISSFAAVNEGNGNTEISNLACRYMYVEKSEISETKVKYSVYLRENISVLGAIVVAEFDSRSFKVISSNLCRNGAGSVNVPGVYISDFLADNGDMYSAAFVRNKDFNTTDSPIAFMEFVFEKLQSTEEDISLNFYCNELVSDNTAQPEIEYGSMLLFYSETLKVVLGESEGFSYRVNDDNTAVITGYRGDLEVLTVPDIIDGFTVTQIDEYAFFGKDNLTELTIPATVRKIGFNAFGRCPNISVLKYLSIPIQWNSIIKQDSGLIYENILYICDIEGHINVTDRRIEPTCTETGLTEGSHCERCNEIVVKQETIKELGHSYNSVSEFIYTKEKPFSGTATAKCVRCQNSETVDCSFREINNGNYVASADFSDDYFEERYIEINEEYKVNEKELTLAEYSSKYIGASSKAEAVSFFGNKLSASDILGTGSVAVVKNSDGRIISVQTVVVFGDVNGDGLVNSLDSEISDSVMMGDKEYAAEQISFFKANDITCDGVIDVLDDMYLLRYMK